MGPFREARQAGSVGQQRGQGTAHRVSAKKLRVFRGIRFLPSSSAGYLSAFRVDKARNDDVCAGGERLN